MRLEAITDGVSIVLLGSFNPRIFHPAWLAMRGIISSEQADEAEVNFVTSEITRFTAAYMTFEVQSNRFFVRCDTVHKDLIKDLVLTTFGEHLPHSPVWKLGINRAISFSCGTEGARDQLGGLLAPREPWGPWGREIDQSKLKNVRHGGMVQMIMRQEPRPDGLDGYIQANVHPQEDDTTNVIVDINGHFGIGDSGKIVGCLDAIGTLSDHWQSSIENAEYIADGLMAAVEGLK
ncbi:MAG: hypothetical protein HKM94_01430 [Halobacteria archaeon]|nr:hypothetical protein [Halobacteria archaeon]